MTMKSGDLQTATSRMGRSALILAAPNIYATRGEQIFTGLWAGGWFCGV
jgi:hypothetical protein